MHPARFFVLEVGPGCGQLGGQRVQVTPPSGRCPSFLLVLVGVRADGTKELIAITDGHRESAGSWADLLRDATEAA